MSSEPPAGFLTVADVAAIFSRLAGREIKVGTVWAYRKQSRPMVGQQPGRYADNPMPEPVPGLRTLLWPEASRPALEAWWNSRLTRSHGKGRQASGKRLPAGGGD